MCPCEYVCNGKGVGGRGGAAGGWGRVGGCADVAVDGFRLFTLPTSSLASRATRIIALNSSAQYVVVPWNAAVS